LVHLNKSGFSVGDYFAPSGREIFLDLDPGVSLALLALPLAILFHASGVKKTIGV
jgi:hypothetical protein